MYFNYIAILLLLIVLFQFLSTFVQIKEGLENKPDQNSTYKGYGNDPLILAQHNAGNIKFLNEHMKDLINLKNQIPSMQLGIKNMKKQMGALQKKMGVLQHVSSLQANATAQHAVLNSKYPIKNKNYINSKYKNK